MSKTVTVYLPDLGMNRPDANRALDRVDLADATSVVLDGRYLSLHGGSFADQLALRLKDIQTIEDVTVRAGGEQWFEQMRRSLDRHGVPYRRPTKHAA